MVGMKQTVAAYISSTDCETHQGVPMDKGVHEPDPVGPRVVVAPVLLGRHEAHLQLFLQNVVCPVTRVPRKVVLQQPPSVHPRNKFSFSVIRTKQLKKKDVLTGVKTPRNTSAFVSGQAGKIGALPGTSSACRETALSWKTCWVHPQSTLKSYWHL